MPAFPDRRIHNRALGILLTKDISPLMTSKQKLSDAVAINHGCQFITPQLWTVIRATNSLMAERYASRP